MVVAGGISLVAYLLPLVCWYDGRQGRYGLLLLCNLLRLLLLLIAFLMLPGAVGLGGKDKPPVRADRFALLSVACMALMFLACAGAASRWTAVLGAVATLLTVLVWYRQRHFVPGGRPVLLRAVIAGAAFMFIWYQCASTTASALTGLGERLEATGGSERLRAWAAEVIAATPAGQWRHLRREEIPDFVDDLMGRIPGFPTVWVYNMDQPCVVVANGSGYGYGVAVCPDGQEPQVGFGGMVRTTWRPGIYFTTVFK
jgi:hypothetical protein